MEAILSIVALLLLCAVLFYQTKSNMHKEENEELSRKLREKNMSEEEKAKRLSDYLKKQNEKDQERWREENGL
jgi:uncharacterized protein YlxW (UPF0749 family)